MTSNSDLGCSPAEGPPMSFSPESSLLQENNDSCCEGKDLTGDQAGRGTCCTEPIKNKGCKSTSPLEAGSCQGTSFSEPSEPEREDGCCTTETNREDHGCKPADVASITCRDGCCSGPTTNSHGGAASETRNITLDGDCCATKSTDQRCEKNYLATPEPSNVKPTKTPSCCEDKAFPCCDVSCLDRIALRECNYQRPTAGGVAAFKSPTGSDSTSRCRQGEDGTPCEQHTAAVREKFAATLEALGCICRALLALGQESCCSTQKRSLAPKKRRSKMSLESTPRASTDSCCTTGARTNTCNARVQPCSDKGRKIDNANACIKSCCEEVKDFGSADCCGDVNCTDQKPSDSIVKSMDMTSNVAHTTDLEKGSPGKEHVILSISGMTCTGCETKLKRTLGTVESVKNLKTSLILARAEFDFDPDSGTLADVLKHLERTTEFKYERIMNQGSSIDLVAIGDAFEFVQKNWPLGVTEMMVVDKKIVNIAFDAKIVGARDLAEKGWGTPLKLAAPRGDPTLEAGSKHVRHVGYLTLLSTALTIPVLVMAWAPLPEREIVYGSASLALATIVQFVIAGPFYPKALKSLIFSRMIEMDLLIVLSTSAAFIFSVVSFGYLVAGQPLSTGQFFETSTLLVTLIMVGRYASALARQKAVESISIRSLQASTATLVDQAGGRKTEIDARLLQYGDVFQIDPDSKIPTDGTVISGSSEVDESMLTGESKPVEKHAQSAVIAGSLNGSRSLIVRLTRLPGENTISTIAGMVDEAKLSKPKIQEVADRVASYFVPVVVLLTIVTLIIWIAVGVTVREQSGAEASVQAITYAITVLIVSCPCAIGLAVPMVIVIASGVAAERGVVCKSANSIELAYKTSHVVLDKTGTLTHGKLSVAVEEHLGSDVSASMPLLLGLVRSIKHPVSAALTAYLETKGVLASAVNDQKLLTGKGVEGRASGQVLRAGNCHWLNFSSHPKIQPILSKGLTAFCFTIDGSLTAVFGLEDSLRPDALFTVTKLHTRGIVVHIISGDDDGAVRSIAEQLGIPSNNVRSRCSPADKQAYIQDLLASTKPENPGKKPKKPVIMFCGDGTNDAVALAQATIGVHMNEGTDVAKSAADVVLMRPSLAGILTTIDISKKSINRIKFNFGWSFVYNLFAILLGAGAFVNVRIPPQFAGLGELVSVLPVIVAAVLLRWSKI